MTNIVTAPIGANRMTKTRSIYQYNYGQVLVLTGVDLPATYEVHFSNSEFGVSKVQVGNADGVTIPDEYLQSGADIYAWLYLHTGADDGETVYKILIPVEKRASISPEEPTPVQQDAITQAIAALNDAVDRTAQDVEDADNSAQAAQRSAEDAQQAARDAEAAATGSVHFDVEQTLTAEEKARARANIGAASGSDIPTGTVRYDESQTLTDTEKAQAQENIGIQVATTEEVEAIITAYDEEDEYMIFEMTFENLGHGEGRYTSVETTETIMNAYAAGKHVTLHFPEVLDFAENAIGSCLASITGANADEGKLYCNTVLKGQPLTEMVLGREHIEVYIFAD